MSGVKTMNNSNKRDLILEIGTEEIPARFMENTLQQMEEIVSSLFQHNRIKFDGLEVYGTPRRLAVLVRGAAEMQEDLEEKKRGPSKKAAFDGEGSPTKAASGFAGSQGVKVEELTVEEYQGGEYVFAVKKIKGRKTKELLPDILKEAVRKITFPKPMYWESKEVRFARPIRWLLALYGKDKVPFSFAGLESGNLTYGHRFLDPGPFEIEDPQDYFKVLQKAMVVIDQNERKNIIRKQAEEAAFSLGGRALIDENLLEEVNYLVEYPRAVAGDYSTEFLELPKDVLITTMQSHQRYFPVVEGKGKLLPHFITISNLKEDIKGNIKAGNERVLRARLADARFFFMEDQKVDPDDYVERLNNILFQEELGTVHEKIQRIVNLSEYMADLINVDSKTKQYISRAAYLCKFDLVTNMVSEFPELQGIMGREYAALAGEAREVAAGIYEHYLPRFTGDDLPASMVGALVGIADKIDNITGCFGIGLQPTGSQDPYALRRQALGIVHILFDSEIRLPLNRVLEFSVKQFGPVKLKKPGVEIIEEVRDFIHNRIKHILLEKGFRYDLVDAVLGIKFEIVYRLYKKTKYLKEAVKNPDFPKLMTAFTRAANLAKNAPADGEVRLELLEDETEKVLYQAYNQVKKVVDLRLQDEDYSGVLTQLALMQKPVDEFFDQVMVMVENETLKNNRLSLLRDIRDLFLQYADFSKIVEY